MFRYTALRFGLIVACFGVIWGLVWLRILPAGVGGSNYLWIGLLSLVISAPLSWVLLRGVREQAARTVSERVERTRPNFAANASQEDEADDAAREESPARTEAPARAESPARDGEPHTA